uniref:Uncharacterized protein n=1 Tax=Canis lupus dingo TaxID=286419 RepID=A0A8C0JUA8_CANLU
ILLLHLLNGNVSSKNIDIKLSHSIFALRKNFEVIKFTRQVGYAKREMHGKLPADQDNFNVGEKPKIYTRSILPGVIYSF